MDFIYSALYFQWARDLGLRGTPKVRVPVYPVQHFLIMTEPLAGLPAPDSLPYIRDFDSNLFIRQYEAGFMVGGFERNAKAAFVDEKIPFDWKDKLTQDWNHFSKHKSIMKCRLYSSKDL